MSCIDLGLISYSCIEGSERGLLFSSKFTFKTLKGLWSSVSSTFPLLFLSLTSVAIILGVAEIASRHWIRYLQNTLNSKVRCKASFQYFKTEFVVRTRGRERGRKGSLVFGVFQQSACLRLFLIGLSSLDSFWLESRGWTEGSWVWVTMVIEQHHP